MRILVTGAAGFIGYHLSMAFMQRGDEVVGLDNVNSYYDPTLKEARLKELDKASVRSTGHFRFVRADVADRAALDACFAQTQFDRVIHLAAQAGVRHSLERPEEYVQSNLVGFSNILECCRYAATPHLTYASTSSVYGANTKLPFSEHDTADHPVQFYAATKRANELMAHSYSHLFNLPTTGLRFFTVYGPWGRPDMALFKFTKAMLAGESIPVFNHGKHSRDFTYVDDIVEGVIRTSDQVAQPSADWNGDDPDVSTSKAPYRIFNIGASKPVLLSDFIEALEDALGIKAEMEMLPLQPGDVPDTFADVSELMRAVGYKPQVSVKDGVARFVDWYRSFYRA